MGNQSDRPLPPNPTPPPDPLPLMRGFSDESLGEVEQSRVVDPSEHTPWQPSDPGTFSAELGMSCVVDHPFSVNAALWSDEVQSRIYGLTTYAQQREFAESWEEKIPVLRVKAPSPRCQQQLGPAGLNLEDQFSMRAIAVEHRDEIICFDVNPSTVLAEGDSLWFGVKSTPGPLQHLPKGVPKSAVDGVKAFLETSELEARVEIGQLPVCVFTVPNEWCGQPLEHLNLQEAWGVTLCALQSRQRLPVTFFPPLHMQVMQGDRMWMPLASARNFIINRRSRLQ